MKQFININYKKIYYRSISLLLIVLMLTANVLEVNAMSDFQRRALKSGVLYANTLDSCDPGGTGGSSVNGLLGKKVFFIGDSLTVGAVSGGLLDKAKSAGMVLDTAYESLTETSGSNSFDRVKGKSVEATVGYRISNTIDNLKEHEADFSTGAADIIVVALGTNPETNFATSSASLITYLRGKNTGLTSKTSILWVNTNYTSAANITPSTTTNIAINESAQANNFTVLDIASDTSATPDGADGIHSSSDGFSKRADAIVALMSSALISTSSSASVGVLSYEENHKFAWDYLVNKKGLSPNAAAGLMGNLEAESGINPQNVQDNAKGIPDGPEIPIDAITTDGIPFRGEYGYGIAQWTSEGRQLGLVDFATSQNKLSGAIDLQFDYLWFELENSYDDVLAVLRSPDVTLNEASDYVLIEFETPASVIFDEDKETQAQHEVSFNNAIQARRALGEKMLQLYNGSTFSGTSSFSCNPTAGNGPGSNGNTGYVNPEGDYAFPLEPQTKRGIGGIGEDWLGLLRPNGAPVHGDNTAAYDLFSFVDADVYAITNGEIYAIDTNFNDIEGCSAIQFKADDGYYYWYGHLKNTTVTKGLRVTTGQKIAEIADASFTTTCTGGGGPHLHIDRGCVIDGEAQTAGRDECRDLDFIEFLSNIYETLP